MDSSIAGCIPIGMSLPPMLSSPRGLERLCHAGLDQAEADRIHVDVVAAPFLGESLRESNDSGLASGVACLPGIPFRARYGSDIDDLAHHTPAAGFLLLGGFAKIAGSGAQQDGMAL